MGGVQMLDKHIGHTRCDRKMFQQPSERFESARRSSDTHHRTFYMNERRLRGGRDFLFRVLLALFLNEIFVHQLLLSSLIVGSSGYCYFSDQIFVASA